MTTWSEIVTTALLGTDRRPVPTELPAWAVVAGVSATGEPEGVVLALAAAHRVATHAGRPAPPAVGPLGAAPVPRQQLRLAPLEARRQLDAVLVRPDPSRVTLWLTVCARHGFGLAPEHWAPVLAAASRSSAYERSDLAAVLGARGRWFARQNPEWRKLSAALDEQALVEAGDSSSGPVPRPASAAAPTADQVARDPERLLALPDPWPEDLVEAALAGMVRGTLGHGLRAYIRVMGPRLTRAQYAELGRTAQRFLDLPQLDPSLRRGVRAMFVETERVAYERVELDRAFDPSREPVFRVSIPPV